MVFSFFESMRDTSMSDSPAHGIDNGLSAGERELLRELVCALRTIRYGSLLLTVHDGRIVEIHKTEKIRKAGFTLKD